MGIQSVLEKKGDGLVISIPREFLPPPKRTTPQVDETVEYVPLVVRPYGNRTALSLTYSEGVTPVDALTVLGFDPWQPIQIQLYGDTQWLNAHLFHGFRLDIGRRAYGRVWIPHDTVRRLRINEYEVYPVRIRGWTPERYAEERISVEHFGTLFQSTEQGQWILPKQYLFYYDILNKAKDFGVDVVGDFHQLNKDTVQVDFLIDKEQSRYLLPQVGYAQRFMTLRNYTSRDSGESAKYLLCEIRATMLTMYPREYYQDKQHYKSLMDALRITVRNLSMFFTQSIRYCEKIDAQFEREHGYPPDPPKVEYETLGEENNVHVSSGETFGHPFYYVEKYIRITNEQSARRKSGRNVRLMDGRLWNFFRLRPAHQAHIYDNYMVESILKANPILDIDKSGFVWIKGVD